MPRLTGKTAIITGAANGIGAAIATLFAAEGARVLLSDIDEAEGQAVLHRITRAGGTAHFLAQDVTDEAAWPNVIETAVQCFGGLHCLVNNAGVQLSRPLDQTSLADWRKVFSVNAEGVFLGTSCAIEAMARAQTSGSIVNISSTFAMVADHLNAAYCASKAASRQFTKAAALHCAERGIRVRVNSIHPGVIATPMLEREIQDVTAERGLTTDATVRAEWAKLTPLGIGRPEDIAYGALYLASDESVYVTASELVIDGGHLAR
jgi:3(or 17)beta-hydroxysteroid dehydrogenase